MSNSQELIKHYPTLESLFGSVDFCECEHCRSVLSPAAYFVDLLQLLDTDEKVWANFLDNWKAGHNKVPYTDKYEKPYDALVERRPDLPHLPLTCENTNTVLPYVDVVNEILEYYVAKGKLEPAAVHDTGDATTPELLAEPQNIVPEAYDLLKKARYPLALPFDLWLETVRRFFDHFQTPLWQVLEVFRPTDELFPPEQTPKPYYRAAIFAEYLGISPDEYAIFTEANPLAEWFKLFGYTSDAEARTIAEDEDKQRVDLNSAKALSRRLGVSYKELVELVRTSFVNPRLDALVILRKLGVDVRDVFLYRKNEALLSKDETKLSEKDRKLFEELKAFKKRLDDLKAEYGFDAQAWLNTAWPNDFNKILLLADPDAGCNFDKTTLQYANGDPAQALDFLKINLLVRLWKKLGWTIEETDRALQVFLPRNSLPLASANIGAALKSALVYLAHLKALDERVKAGRNSRLKLLTIWSNLSNTGKNPLYAQLFLTRRVLKNDGVFDDALGNYLSKGGVFVKHLLALQAALNLTADEVERILTDAGKNLGADLSLANVSLLYRYGLFAKALKLSVRDLIVLKALAGVDPFKPPSPDPLQKLAEDHPFGQTLRFAEIVEVVKESGLGIEDLDYLLRHRFDPVGKYRPDPDALIALVKTLATGIRRIQIENAAPEDFTTLSDDLLRQKLGLVLPPDVAERFLGMLAGTVEFEAVQDKVKLADRLDPKAFAGEPALRVSYDPVRDVQRLSFRGMLLDAKKKELEDANQSHVLKNLLGAVRENAGTSFATQLETLLDLLTATVEYEAIEKNVQLVDKLNPKDFDKEPAIRVRYDEAAKTQRLTYRGMLLDAKKAELEIANQSHVLKKLLEAVQSQVKEFTDDLLESSIGTLIASVEFEAIQEKVDSADKLDPATFAQEPAIRVSYDEAGKMQRLTYQGMLTEAKKASLNPNDKSQLLVNLFGAVQSQAKAFVKSFRLGFLVASDFDSPFGRLDDLAETTEQSRSRLAKAILPFVQKKLIRQLVVQTMATTLNADPALTEALVTDASLLSDPTQPGNPLLDAFAAAGESGVSLSFFASADGTGAPLDARIATAADTKAGPKDQPRPVAAKSARLEGYLEVPVAGAYRFFVVFEKKELEAEFRLSALPDPIIHYKATKDDDEISQFVDLKAGVPYRFTIDARNLDGDIRLLVHGENLPKGSLDRLTLYPETAVERLTRSRILLGKTLQLIQSVALSEREVRYLLTHAADFDDLDLSKLPTREADDSRDGAMALFGQFLRLADYARLKRDLAAGTDDLIGVFENARRTHSGTSDLETAKSAHFEPVANLTRRDEGVVRATAERLGFSITAVAEGSGVRVETPDLSQEKGLGRLWQTLQLVEKLGVPVEAIARWATPAPKVDIARDLKNTVKARYEPENWQRIAQSIFDKLRQSQRDALVAYVIHQNGFERIEQLFEYFLIDPGMEPVVQTSRLRLAISSVQLFIQRCLLNLESKVPPSAVINARHWQWMKRYRVWEANRKIFLFPENWLEPEFRDDKTHLFQELEGALLQGDVSNDLAEDAFFKYLKKLEELAQLEMVAMYLDEKPDPELNTLHVIGRTHNLPHKYFYRRYAHQMWTPWEPVTAEIEGDHVVAVVWRDRLHLFWVTFMEKAKQEDTNSKDKIKDVADRIVSTAVKKEVEVQLNWSEYFQGQWTTREASGFDNPIRAEVWDSSLDRNKVFIHVSKENDEKDGREGAVIIHLNGPFKPTYLKEETLVMGDMVMPIYTPVYLSAFRVVSKNSQPEIWESESPVKPPYVTAGQPQPTSYTGSNGLQVKFVEKIENGNNLPAVSKDILQQGDKFSLLPSAYPFTFETDSEIAALVRRFFYQDNQHTFFVEPALSTVPIQSTEEFGITSAVSSSMLGNLEAIGNQAQVPLIGDPPPFDRLGHFVLQPNIDWVTGSTTVIEFDGRFVGRGGGLNSVGLEKRNVRDVNR